MDILKIEFEQLKRSIEKKAKLDKSDLERIKKKLDFIYEEIEIYSNKKKK